MRRLTDNLISFVRWQVQEFSIPEPSEADKSVNKQSWSCVMLSPDNGPGLTIWGWAAQDNILPHVGAGQGRLHRKLVLQIWKKKILDNIWHFISLSVLNWFYFQFLQLFNSEENWELNLNFAKVMILCDLQKDLNFLTDSISQDIPKSL